MEPGSAETVSAERLSAPLSFHVPVPSVPAPVPASVTGLNPQVNKLTRGHSCVLCQQRKVRCDKQKPCANCVRAKVECKVIPPQPARRRRKRPNERDLVERLKKYEALMSQHGLSFDPIASEFRAPDGGDDVTDLEHDLSGLKTSPAPSTQDTTNAGDGEPTDKRQKWFAYYKEYRTANDYLIDESEDEFERPTIHHAFDFMYGNTDGFPFVVGGSSARITSLHPQTIQIFQLWQVYISNIDPLLKISHVPTLQGQIVGATGDLAKVSKPLEALMFAIYLISVTSMAEEDVQSLFDEDKKTVLARYHGAAQQALINAGFMKTIDIMVLQAYLLYLYSIRQYVDPRSLFCLIGIASRIATRLGLHRDGAQFGLPPFETEQRRRLWWQIVALDKRIAEITGSPITVLSSSGTDCRLPLNVNDTDLHPHAKDPPSPYTGATEMTLCLTRIELTLAAAPDGIRYGPSGGGKPPAQNSPSPSSPADATARAASQNPHQDLHGFCAYMESAYLKHCDPKIPLHFFTLMMTRTALCKLRIVEQMCRGSPTTGIGDQERESLFIDAINLLEYDTAIHLTDSVRNFIWYTHLQFPMPAYLFLVAELRHRTSGELCERAWQAICKNYEHRGVGHYMNSPMHVSFGHMFVKAWDAHAAAEARSGRAPPQAPKLVTTLRERLLREGPPPRAAQARASGPPLARGLGRGGGGEAAVNPGTDLPMCGPETAGGGGAAMWASARPEPDGVGQASAMMPDESTMFTSLEGMNQMYGTPAYDQMDWTSLMQYNGFAEGGGFGGLGGLGGFSGGPWPFFGHGAGGQGHHQPGL